MFSFIEQVTGQTHGWMGIGFSEVNGMTNADIIMFGYDDKGPYLYVSFKSRDLHTGHENYRCHTI